MVFREHTVEVRVVTHSGRAVGMPMPRLDVPTVNRFLRELSGRLAPDAHAVMIRDRAGSHTGKAPEVPANITFSELPLYAPVLNPNENPCHAPLSHYRSLRVYRDYEASVDAAVAAWRGGR